MRDLEMKVQQMWNDFFEGGFHDLDGGCPALSALAAQTGEVTKMLAAVLDRITAQ
jgi:hypothetical protein